jgi:hypothetical protein
MTSSIVQSNFFNPTVNWCNSGKIHLFHLFFSVSDKWIWTYKTPGHIFWYWGNQPLWEKLSKLLPVEIHLTVVEFTHFVFLFSVCSLPVTTHFTFMSPAVEHTWDSFSLVEWFFFFILPHHLSSCCLSSLHLINCNLWCAVNVHDAPSLQLWSCFK